MVVASKNNHMVVEEHVLKGHILIEDLNAKHVLEVHMMKY